jgi:hypothetical protein
VHARYWVRLFVNALNGSTLLGLVAALLGRARLTHGPDGLVLGWGYRFPVPPPRTPAFTVGNVILLRSADPQILRHRPTLLTHEARHSTQYAFCLGIVMIVLYLAAAAWSWIMTGDPASRNIFERLAGLAVGGYVERPLRPFFRRWAARPAVGSATGAPGSPSASAPETAAGAASVTPAGGDGTSGIDDLR